MKMRQKSISLFLVFIAFPGWCQEIFENGFFINTNNKRTECLIANAHWVTVPTDFSYKISKNDKAIKNDLTAVVEFSLYTGVKFVRENVQIDRSKSKINELSMNRNPEWSQETIFLKVLVVYLLGILILLQSF